ncbi:MAG: helix-turn-helix transcriptional regulator [Clostridiales bacterium]|jgi:transcriptional regulator with XRE-family HTH domain|nr:helix-turn-helix transcriptional regulator [Clostridiales bacterium]
MQNAYLTELREDRGLTQAELALKLNLSPSAISSYEQGVRIPRDAVKIKIANFFGVSIFDIFYRGHRLEQP